MTDPVDRSGSGARVLPFKGGAAGGARTDDQLLRTFLEGDEAVFGELFRRHEPAVFAIVRRYARGSEDGRDLTQRAFLRAFEAPRPGRLDRPASLKPEDPAPVDDPHYASIEEAFEALEPALLAYARRLTGDAAMSEDVVTRNHL